jgi:hypothetical protein
MIDMDHSYYNLLRICKLEAVYNQSYEYAGQLRDIERSYFKPSPPLEDTLGSDSNWPWPIRYGTEVIDGFDPAKFLEVLSHAVNKFDPIMICHIREFKLKVLEK